MLKLPKKQVLLTAIGLTVLTGATASALTLTGKIRHVPLISSWFQSFESIPAQLNSASFNLTSAQDSAVLPLATQAAAERAAKLEAIAKGSPSIDRSRARYLLASDLIQQDHGGKALPWLKGLEKEYPVLAAQILAKRAQAYRATGNSAQAEATWKQLVEQYPKAPIAAEALFQLGKQNPQFWDQALDQFPAHPRSVEIAITRLEKEPNQPGMLLLLTRHAVYLPNIRGILDRLRTEYARQLKPEDWEAIGFAAWENGLYGSAASAYAKAPNTPLNFYRAGRGAQLNEQGQTAYNFYNRLVQAFPDAKETGMALVRLADLAETPQAAIGYLDRAINQFPNEAAEALLKKSKLLQAMGSNESALKARQSILTQYSASETAAEIRWEQAELNAKKGDAQAAWEWARQVVEQNPDSELAPEASFWVGKWATTLGKPQEAAKAFEYTLSQYPQSYYAWRSASSLGWENVGDFSSVRTKQPQVVKPEIRPDLLAGSDATKELYRLGQKRDAWSQWQVEFTNYRQPTVAEQFTDGLLRLGVNDNLDGIYMLSSLGWRDSAAEKAEAKAIKQQPAYWQALYPFPYLKPIEQAAQQQQINPLLITALMRQESRFEPEIVSVAEAIGLMQVIPETAEWVASQINLKNYNLKNPTDNIKIGTWYLNYTHREYQDNSLLAVASYNAGPGAVAEWVQEFGAIDPDQFIERIPYPETKGYVTSVLENYWNYLRIYNPEVSAKLAQFSENHAVLHRN
ncbi:transglycosylase SLT domain-containing protein [Leptolyngbya sp. GB1-A1]|uniref:lytic transglycosylase domain-containing protein n=1 Tax=unclassified Leptolyngbya TaxID=2650499 RepID=UPI00198C085A|nr:transglycosylase SLT domain-containing protein [Cyanobacteria bacterium FACHB-502]